jgi:selenocysteine lyase/cysteine desulfurase
MPLDRPPLPRDQFPVAERWVYLNHAGIAPLPRVAYEAAREAGEAWLLEGGEAEPRYAAHIEDVRRRAATLMGCSWEQVAFIKNTTEGLSFAANGLEWKPGDRVIVPDSEYPSVLFPFLAFEDQGVEVVRIAPGEAHGELPVEAFAAALEAGPARLVALSWIQYGTGFRAALPEITALAHEHGALVCADIIQGLGVFPTDLPTWDVDIAMADGHKWLLGTEGQGFLYVAQRHLDADTFRVTEPGWNSVTSRDDFDVLDLDLDTTARRYEGGGNNYAAITALGASIDLLTSTGIDPIWAHVDEWCQTAADELEKLGAHLVTTRDPEHRSGIVTFRVDGLTGAELRRRLKEAGIATRPRVGGVRVSPHGWNDDADLAALLAAVRDCIHG